MRRELFLVGLDLVVRLTQRRLLGERDVDHALVRLRGRLDHRLCACPRLGAFGRRALRSHVTIGLLVHLHRLDGGR